MNRILKGPCLLTGNASTAFGRRVKWYEENVGPVPDGMTLDASCGDQWCHASDHIWVRAKIVKQSPYEYAFSHIESLAIGETVGLAVPDGKDPEAWASGLRNVLRTNRMFMLSRWGVRLRMDGVVIVRRIGAWTSIASGAPLVEIPQPSVAVLEPKACECGCGQITAVAKRTTRGNVAGQHVRFIQGHHNKVRSKKMAVCPGCGVTFCSNGRRCCSRACAAQFRITMNTQRPDDAKTKMERGFRRKKCSVCGCFFWCKPYLKRDACSIKCKQIKCLRKTRKIQSDRDRDILYDLFMVKKWSYAEINKYFGAHPNSKAAYRACRDLGFPHRIMGIHNNPPRDAKRIAPLYLERGMSINKIAKLFPCSPNHISRLLKREGISLRGASKVASGA